MSETKWTKYSSHLVWNWRVLVKERLPALSPENNSLALASEAGLINCGIATLDEIKEFLPFGFHRFDKNFISDTSRRRNFGLLSLRLNDFPYSLQLNRINITGGFSPMMLIVDVSGFKCLICLLVRGWHWRLSVSRIVGQSNRNFLEETGSTVSGAGTWVLSGAGISTDAGRGNINGRRLVCLNSSRLGLSGHIVSGSPSTTVVVPAVEAKTTSSAIDDDDLEVAAEASPASVNTKSGVRVYRQKD